MLIAVIKNYYNKQRAGKRSGSIENRKGVKREWDNQDDEDDEDGEDGEDVEDEDDEDKDEDEDEKKAGHRRMQREEGCDATAERVYTVGHIMYYYVLGLSHF